MTEPTIIKCSCGAVFYDTVLKKTGFKCPKCGTMKDMRKWKIFKVSESDDDDLRAFLKKILEE